MEGKLDSLIVDQIHHWVSQVAYGDSTKPRRLGLVLEHISTQANLHRGLVEETISFHVSIVADQDQRNAFGIMLATSSASHNRRIESLGPTILLGCVRNGHLAFDAARHAKAIEGRRDVFTTVVRAKGFHSSTHGVFHLQQPVLERLKDVAAFVEGCKLTEHNYID
ncbi:BZ3500_MvSof-1268-A1-R1_Chr1-1g01070 [Microbotryum saponariae]|uniref:BZ3500_MvSof-1268-A1-R1_Chr1-1g01070 protein n=1 Tax=Microbotryum saponariae TaxID=289078 RepID=A0A2X0K9A4_9BASI|nr:BZ3500_MvSof-1268-A1-R1_Chr1-1g01070 [Microbotryum saponariae]SCZ93354.1 BZ3501_MvSof-1269-A2-R1_Chr1-1g00667 [Microbotryum saponariae]